MNKGGLDYPSPSLRSRRKDVKIVCDATILKDMKNLSRGGAGLWFLVVIAILGIWIGVRVGQLYFDHASLEKEVKALAMNELTAPRPAAFEANLQRALESYGADFDPENISIRLGNEGTRMFVRIPYRRKLNLGVGQKWVYLDVDVEQDAPRQGGIIHDMQEQVEQSYEGSAQRYEDSVKKAFSN